MIRVGLFGALVGALATLLLAQTQEECSAGKYIFKLDYNFCFNTTVNSKSTPSPNAALISRFSESAYSDNMELDMRARRIAAPKMY